jgi:ADP-heptose:LPS heptosyltransferase
VTRPPEPGLPPGVPRGPEPGVHRIAVLRANALGDLVFALPALDALKATYPDAELVLLGRAWHLDFLRDRPGPVDRVVVTPASRGVNEDGEEDPAALDAFFARMRAERFDLALQLHGGGRWSNPFVTRLGARLTAGPRDHDAEPLDRWLRYVLFQPEIARWLEVTGLVGARPRTVAPHIPVTERDRAEAAPHLPDDRPLVVLHPGAGDARRHWPAERFAAVGDALAARGFAVAVNGTAPERPIVDAVLGAMRTDALDLSGRLSLPALVGVLAHASLLVTNDSGPMHVGLALGTPTVGVYWIGNLVTAGPLVRAHHRSLPAFRIHCPACGADCMRSDCGHRASFVAEVAVEDVQAAAEDLLAAYSVFASSTK